jgi:hypothetical protein
MIARIALTVAGMAALVALAGVACARTSDDLPGRGSVLAFPLVSGSSQPGLVLAQRTIERRWGPSDDSTYREVSVSGWKSEGGGFLLSMAVPGAGEIYAGERIGYLFMLTEAIAFYETWELRRSANQRERDARAWAGDPTDSLSRFSFDAYEKRTKQSSAYWRSLYYADPSLFYFEISRNPSLRPGWEDQTGEDIMGEQFTEWRENVEVRRKHARYWQAAIWMNHAAAAFEALRAARVLNLPLRENIQLRLKSGWNRGGPQVAAVMERRF